MAKNSKKFQPTGRKIFSTTGRYTGRSRILDRAWPGRKGRLPLPVTTMVNAVRGILRLIRDTTNSNQLQPASQTTRMNALYIYPDEQLASGILDGYFLTDNTNF